MTFGRAIQLYGFSEAAEMLAKTIKQGQKRKPRSKSVSASAKEEQ
jgi:hypothetical protein